MKDPEFETLIKREWASFLEINDSSTSSPTILWETGKAVLRGIISFSAYKKKKENQQESELHQKIKQLETTNATNPLEENEKKLRQPKLDLKEIRNKKTNFLISRLRQENFNHNNKSSKYLASQIKIQKEKSTISSIKNSAGKPTNSPDEINLIFKEFHTNLYSDNNPQEEHITSFLASLDLPQLSTEQKNKLNTPLTNEEIQSAPNKMPNNKAPGPDGFPAEFYKHFWSILSTLFNKIITEIQQNSRFPPNMNAASISLLLKPIKDPTLPSSYRPISLLSVDIKIITKALSHRLEKIIPSIIHPDQTGFIKGRNSSNNTRRCTIQPHITINPP